MRLASHVALPTIITEPGEYVTRCDEVVTVTDIEKLYGHVPQRGYGHYHNDAQTLESWDISGRLLPHSLSDNDIVGPFQRGNGEQGG